MMFFVMGCGRSIVDVSVLDLSGIALMLIDGVAVVNRHEEAKELKMERCTPILIASLYLLTGNYLSLIQEVRLLFF
jgi:hypothetical protein